MEPRLKEGSIASCSMLPSRSTFASLSWCQSLCQIRDLFFIKPGVDINGQCCWDILLSQEVLDRVVVFQQHSAPVQLAFNTVQLLRCKTLNYLSSDLWPNTQSRAS